MFPYRLLVCLLTETSARLGADVVRYTFIVEDFHFLLLASLLANLGEAFHPLTGSNRTLPSTAVRGSVGFAGRITGQHCVIQGWGGVEGRLLQLGQHRGQVNQTPDSGYFQDTDDAGHT